MKARQLQDFGLAARFGAASLHHGGELPRLEAGVLAQ